jgi:hypothetical protein
MNQENETTNISEVKESPLFLRVQTTENIYHLNGVNLSLKVLSEFVKKLFEDDTPEHAEIQFDNKSNAIKVSWIESEK